MSKREREKQADPRVVLTFYALGIIYFIICGFAPSIREHRKEKEKVLLEAKLQEQRKPQIQICWTRPISTDSNDSTTIINREIAQTVHQEQSASVQEHTQQKVKQNAPVAGFSEGYRDGYECGYDDGDCNEGYGYSYLSDGVMARYSSSYRYGFEKGYHDGFLDGREDLEFEYEMLDEYEDDYDY